MTTYQLFAILLLAALIHASFQLSVSMMTLMSGHAIGKKTAHARVMRLIAGFTLGAMTMVALGVSFLALLLGNVFPDGIPILAWAATSGLLIGLGVAVWIFYYRYRKAGTVLWLPRPMAEHLSRRSRKTIYSAEAFGLGLTSVVTELLFGIAPMLIAGLVLLHLDTPMQLVGLIVYTLVTVLPLLFIAVLVGGGRSLARIQRWRESNKRFLQFAAGSALIILGAYLYVETVVSSLVFSGGV